MEPEPAVMRDTAPALPDAISGRAELEVKARANLELVRPKRYLMALLAEPARSAGYERQALGELVSTPDGGLTNATGIFFPKSLTGWGKLVAMRFIDEDGKDVGGGVLDNPHTHPTGETLVFPPGSLTIDPEMASRFRPFDEEEER